MTAPRSRSGAVGEICLRGGYMVGYWDRPEKTAEALRDGWLHTGDAGLVDAEGYVFMRGRLSERLRVAGEYWYPRDLEELLLRHPAVRDAALVGVPDGEGEHRPLAFVTAAPGRARSRPMSWKHSSGPAAALCLPG